MGFTFRRSMLAAVAAVALAGSAQAATILNGSFEAGVPDPGAFATLPAGSGNVDNWTIGGGGIDYIGTYWIAQDGTRSLDLSALGAGSISQDLATDIGSSYAVTFFMSGNPDGAPGLKTLVASAGAASEEFTIDASTFSSPDIVWTPFTFNFTATSATTTLTFTSGVDTAYGAAIDNVAITTLTAVPEPASWAMLIAGLGLVGYAQRRRGRPVAA
ncbi:choice-of-anchor C family protein [Sandarakinorhabdus sp. DWP1-3-1]|uniref:choice-of-anchor C family protein n=1 Tax=Sandarakinorhabdus sp. DWP1-3-1 TaxID=2804627 RepID=UPI003CF1D989